MECQDITKCEVSSFEDKDEGGFEAGLLVESVIGAQALEGHMEQFAW